MTPPPGQQVELTNTRVVAIDGGTATGKGRLIDELSQLLRRKGIPAIHLSTGSLYRAVAWAALEHIRAGFSKRQAAAPDATDRALGLLRQMTTEQYLEHAYAAGIEMHSGQVWMYGELASIEAQIKGPGAGTGSSIVSKMRPVRQFVDLQTRRQVNEFDGFVLIDGRDIGRDVVPEAPVKVLLTVSPEIAAQRSIEHNLEEILARDKRDREAEHGALPHPDRPGYAVHIIATDTHTPETTRDQVYALMREMFGSLPEL